MVFIFGRSLNIVPAATWFVLGRPFVVGRTGKSSYQAALLANGSVYIRMAKLGWFMSSDMNLFVCLFVLKKKSETELTASVPKKKKKKDPKHTRD